MNISANTSQPHIMVFCVNYGSYDYLRTFMQSVERSAAMADGLCHVTLCVGDNTAKDWQGIPEGITPHCTLHSFPYHLNLGYLGCALRMMSEMGWENISEASHCIICNVDLTLHEDFFRVLSTTLWPTDAGWLAPDIYTKRLQHHDNPYHVHRPSKHDFWRWRILYSHPVVFKWLEKIYNLRNQHQQMITSQQSIYAGHGSLMIFTGLFLKNHPFLHFPAFMYGEEIFFAELIWRDKLKVYYCPSLHVNNTGRVSTGKLNYKWLCRQSKKSLSILRDSYFRDL